LKLRLSVLALLVLSLVAIPALAQNDLYDNGPTNGDIDAYTINFGFIVSDSFQLSSPSTVSSLVFASWLFPGDVLESAEVSFTSEEFGGTVYFDQSVNFTQGNCGGNSFGFNLCDETGSFSGVSLNAGTYWLNLQNAVVNTGDPVYWDVNRGPSMASENSLGSIPSESFTIMGTANSTTTTGTTPEPSALMLFGSGGLGLLYVLRLKFLP
jgi:PEP-CTERM motif-containing protein